MPYNIKPTAELINKLFSENVKKALAKTEKRGTVFNAGMPHPVFVQKGMPSQPFNISPAVIRKAKKSKYNHHSVMDEDLERLPDLLNSPIALLRSLTIPNSFVVVLDTQDNHGFPVIASIKPENGYNEITSIYGRENFERFIKITDEAGAVLSLNKKKAIERVWASILSRGETTVDDYQLSLSPQMDKMSSPNYMISSDRKTTTENFITPTVKSIDKEQNMADELVKEPMEPQQERAALEPAPEEQQQAPAPEEQQKEQSPEERAFWNAVHQRKTVADALKAGVLSCLPGSDGFADTAPAVNNDHWSPVRSSSLYKISSLRWAKYDEKYKRTAWS